MKKIYRLFVLMLMPMMAFAQSSRTINVATAGTLPDLISDEEKYTIEELTLTGELNGTDFRLLRDMAGNNYLGEQTEGKLKVLDLSGASIVAGGEKYLDVDMINNSDLMKGSGPCHLSIETNNTLPNYCFASCKLERLILPDNLTTIDFNGLSYLTKMTYIHLPKSLISIVRGRWSINPFVDCVNLQEIDVDPLNEVYTSIDGVLFSKDGKTLMSYPASKSCDSYDIPSSVTTLFGEAFYYSKNVLSMSIPNGVSGIPDRTFSNSSVSSITIPSSIKSIGNYSFGGCNLGSITFSEGLESIGDGAFWGNKQLESVSIPSTVTQIGANPFRSCEKLQRVEVKDGNSVYDSRNNCNAVVESASNKLVIGCSSTTISNDILIIGSESFYGNKDLTSITIPSSVSVIESYAFNECRNLTTVILPNTITSIGRSAFSFTNLTSVKIPEKITVINENTFFSCTKLVEVILPENLSEIRSEAFSSCWNLNSVKIPSSVTAIGEKAFYACKGLSVVMSDIEEPFMISDDVFALSNGFSTATLSVPEGCKSKYEATDGWKLFTKIEEGEVKEVDGLNYCLSTGSKTATVVSGDYSGLVSVTIPASITVEGVDYKVTAIGDDAFYNCYPLISLVISEGIETIGKNAFSYCSKLNRLELPSTLTSVGEFVIEGDSKLDHVISRMTNPINVPENTFINRTWDNTAQTNVYTPSSATLYVPEGSKSKYEAISGWTKFAKIEEGEVKEVDGLSYRLSTGSKTATVVSGDYYSLVSATIPASVTIDGVDYEVTAIGDGAFEKGRILVHLELPSTLVSIGENAFSSRLKAVVSNMTTPIQLGKQNYMSGATLYVPKGSVNLYEASDSWNIFKKIKAIEPYVEPSTILETPLTFEAVEGTVKVSFFNRWASASFPIKYRIDDGPWSYGIIREDGTWATSHFVGKKLQFIAQFMTNTYSKYVQVSCDNDCYIYGNILSMTNGDDFATISESGTCGKLFSGNTHIKNHPTKGLVLPATSLSNGCYMGLFTGCTSLTVAPELPATILSNRCYQEMFKGCSNINEIVCKAVDVSAENCTTGWLDGVSAVGTFYKDASMTDWTEGVDGIPTGWTVKDFNTKVEKGDVVYTPHDEDHTVTVSDGGVSSSEIVIQSSISINGVSYDVTAIGDCAFQNNELVVKVTIPETIASIGLKAFAGCINLKSIFIYVKVPINLSGVSASRTRGDGGSSVFSGVDTETCVLYVPAGSGEAYRSADVWKEFKNIVEIPVSASIKVAKGMTTYTGEYNLDFSGFGDEVKAYVATGYDYDNNVIWLTRVKDVPAGTPILVKAPASETPYDVPVKASSGCYYKNMLVGNLSGGEITLSATTGEMTNYYLSNGIFCTSTGSNTISHGKAYLQIPTTPPAAVVGSSKEVTLNKNGFASFCANEDLDFSDVEGLKAYAATGYDDVEGTIWLTRVKRVSAGTGLLLMGAASGNYTIPSTGVKSYYANMMVGNTGTSAITIYTTSGDMTNYYLNGNQLKKAAAAGTAGNRIDPGKAYMQIPTAHVTRSIGDDPTENLSVYDLLEHTEVISMQVMTRGLDGDGDTTGIHEDVQPEQDSDVYYNLNGQRVENPGKGLYIKNGKKVILK